MFGSIGMPELMIIFVIALIIFGPRKLPELGRSMGRSLSEFKRASNELRSTLDEEIRVEESTPEPTRPEPKEQAQRAPPRIKKNKPRAPPRIKKNKPRAPPRIKKNKPRAQARINRKRPALRDGRCPSPHPGQRMTPSREISHGVGARP